MNDELRGLHRKVQWTGWRLWFQRAGRKPWPCPTVDILIQ